MTSQVAFQDNMAVRIKAERDAFNECTGTVHDGISWETVKLNSSSKSDDKSSNHARQQITHGKEAIPGESESCDSK